MVLAFSARNQGRLITYGVDIALSELLEKRARQQFGCGKIARIVHWHFEELVSSRDQILTVGTDSSQSIVELLHLLAQHVGLRVDIQRKDVPILLERME